MKKNNVLAEIYAASIKQEVLKNLLGDGIAKINYFKFANPEWLTDLALH